MPQNLSRRHFATLLGAGAAVAAFPSVLARAKPGAPVLLNSNENPHGPSPAAMRAIRDSLGDVFRYPDDAEDELRATIAKLHGVSTSEVLLGNGSSDILRLASGAFPGKLVTANPTFEILWLHARGEVVKVPLDANYAHDLEKMRDGSLVYICNPNNPTATITPKAAVRAYLDAVPASTTVVVDEAYAHYAESPEYESVIPLVASKPNLIVARTFSKVYAMAGLRVGYAIAQKANIDKLRAEQAFNVMSLLGSVAATASLNDTAHVAASRKKNHDVRAATVTELERLGFRTLPSEANFMMVDLRQDVKPVILKLREQGVRVGRVFPAVPQHLRVTIGTMEEMKRFVDAFRVIAAR
ncbi:MAG TPA: aminotransferase class I/II-fold pyridoxal phosphate-dependent enzyme [Thermoanaerobaculia bacterium]|nr:aminotransferase class I/II-fold pyridoxal phosphate-dependent enzyme [Thermoanaerobaculia bacterium]